MKRINPELDAVISDVGQIVEALNLEDLTSSYGCVRRRMDGSTEPYGAAESLFYFVRTEIVTIGDCDAPVQDLPVQTTLGRACVAHLAAGPIDTSYVVCADAEPRFMSSAKNGSIGAVLTRDGKPVAFQKNFHETTLLTLEDIEVKVQHTGGPIRTVEVPKGVIVDIDGLRTSVTTTFDVAEEVLPRFVPLRPSSFALPHDTFDGSNNNPWFGDARDQRGLETMAKHVTGWITE